MQRAHKIRLNPTPEQEGYLKRACGIARFTYNYGLRQYKNALNDHRKPDSITDIKTAFNAIKGEQFPWIYDVTKCAAETGGEERRKAEGERRKPHHPTPFCVLRFAFCG